MDGRSWTTALFLLGVAVTPLGAQLSFGLRGGMIWSEAEFGYSLGWETAHATGAHFGALLAYEVTDILSLESGLEFGQEGAAADDPATVGDLKFWKANVPLLAVLTVPTDWPLRPRALGGFSVSHEVSCRADFTYYGADITHDCEELITPRNKTDVNLVGGGGAFFELGDVLRGGGFFVDLLYIHGLRDMNRDAGADQWVKGRAWRASAGFRVGR